MEYYREHSDLKAEKMAAKDGTMHINRYQKLFGVGPFSLVIGMLVFAVLWLLDEKLGHLKILGQPDLIRMVGLILIGIWICWHTWCVFTLRVWWRDNQLCTKGPFRLVQHPIYTGALVFGFVGASLLINSWILLLSPVIQYLILSYLVRREEAMMATVFGEKYAQYAAQTGRFFPRFPR